MNNQKVNVTATLPIGSLLLILFIALKLTGVIAWSWWWVLSPIWIPIAVAVLVFAGILLYGALYSRSRR